MGASVDSIALTFSIVHLVTVPVHCADLLVLFFFFGSFGRLGT